jgi:predicted ArsR family transcriptional regulator
MSRISLTYLTTQADAPSFEAMSSPSPTKRFLDSTRGRVAALLRRGAHTVEELAAALGLTDNAVRAHLAALERDGLARQSGVRRQPAAGKPPAVYELDPDAEPLFSRAYAPVLAAMVEAVADRLPPGETEAVMRDVGRRVAARLGVRPSGEIEARVHAAAAILAALGGDVEIERTDDALVLRGCGCPLAAAVSRRAESCCAVEELLTQVIGGRGAPRGDPGARPRCRFLIATR